MPDESQQTQPKTAPTTKRPEEPVAEQARIPSSDGTVPSDSGVSTVPIDDEQLRTLVPDEPGPTTPSEEVDSPECLTITTDLDTGPSSIDSESEDEPHIAAPETSSDIEKTVRQRDEYQEQLQRLAAEFNNYKKRTLKKHRELSDQGKRDLLAALLPVVDAMDQALKADANDGVAYRLGVEGIHKQLLDLMFKQGVSPIEAIGADFDPTIHEAVSHEPSENHRNNEVVEELRRGYTLDNGLLRPSMVKVAKA